MILKILKSIIPDAIPRIYYPNQSYHDLKIKINSHQLKVSTNQLSNVFGNNNNSNDLKYVKNKETNSSNNNNKNKNNDYDN